MSLSAPRPSGVVLSTETLAIDEDSVGAASVSPETLTFTSSNYSEAQTVTASGVEDLDGRDEQLLILVLVQTTTGSGSVNPEYTPVGGSGSSVTGVFATVDDDDSGQGCGGV